MRDHNKIEASDVGGSSAKQGGAGWSRASALHCSVQYQALNAGLKAAPPKSDPESASLFVCRPAEFAYGSLVLGIFNELD
jgi:hypothetical protein